MIHLVNIDQSADLEETLAALALCGTVTTPAEGTPRMVLVECTDPSGIMAVEGVCGCCDADKPVELTAVQMFTNPGSHGLADGFLYGKASGVVEPGLGPPFAVGNLNLIKNSVLEGVSPPVQRLPDTDMLDQINADSLNRLAHAETTPC